MASWEMIAKRCEVAYEQLKEEFEQYKKESIKWGVIDFMDLEAEGYEISEEDAQIALEEMIDNHDCNYGIDWATVHYYHDLYATEVEIGKEKWRNKN